MVVEDAPSGGSNAIFEVLAEFEDASDVAVLLDAREGAWDAATDLGGHASLERQRQQLGIVDMPTLDEQECARAIEHFETLTGSDSGQLSEQLYDEVREAEIGSPLVLAYRLTGPAIETDRPVSALHADVRRAYTAVEEWAGEPEFAQTVTTMVNILNAAGLPVEAAFVHAVADDPTDHQQIERTLGFLEGTMLEQSTDGLRLPHQLWSELYLQHMLEAAGERLASVRFERCVEAIFRLFDDEELYSTVQRWVQSPSEAFDTISESPEETAGRFVRQIADIGTLRPRLGTLFGTPETWHVAIPDPCSIDVDLEWWVSRGNAHIDRGALDATQVEFEHARQVINTFETKNHDLTKQRAQVMHNFGEIVRKRDDLDTAETYHEESLALSREFGDRHEEAWVLCCLGVVARKQADLKVSESYHEESLALCRETGDRHVEALSLSNLGDVARDRNDLERAEEYYHESLTILREHGIIGDALTGFSDLINICEQRGTNEVAGTWCKEAIDFAERNGRNTKCEEYRERLAELEL